MKKIYIFFRQIPGGLFAFSCCIIFSPRRWLETFQGYWLENRCATDCQIPWFKILLLLSWMEIFEEEDKIVFFSIKTLNLVKFSFILTSGKLMRKLINFLLNHLSCRYFTELFCWLTPHRNMKMTINKYYWLGISENFLVLHTWPAFCMLYWLTGFWLVYLKGWNVLPTICSGEMCYQLFVVMKCATNYL